jgi:carboxymethylenebutenolidase
MSEWVSLETPTGRINAWRADPPIPAKGALVVLQEIFGVNSHIRGVVDRFAAHGFIAIAPALFDHFGHDIELDYDDRGVVRGRDLVSQLGFERALEDVQTAAKRLETRGNVGVVGYCWGGSLAFLANTRLSYPAVSYYGGRTVPFLQERLDAPMLFHFGERDPIIPPEHVQQHRDMQPGADIHVYPAGHGFNCDQRADYDAASAALALERTLAFFERHLR